jgi:hypothetical protein
MQYSPTVNDRSGEFLSAGIVGAAQTNAQGTAQLGQDISGALTSLAAAYGQRQGTIAKGKNFKKFMGMAGGAFGLDETKLGMFNEMDDHDAGLMLDNFGSWMPAMANAQLGRNKFERSQAAATAAPAVKLYNENRKTISTQGGPGIPMTGLPQTSMLGGD